MILWNLPVIIGGNTLSHVVPIIAGIFNENLVDKAKANKRLLIVIPVIQANRLS